MSVPSKQVVVARYKETLGWVALFDLDTIVYNKSCQPSGQKSLFEVSFDARWRPVVREGRTSFVVPARENLTLVELGNNVRGREAHTYLYHIYHNYHRLADQTFFLQGSPMVHSPDIVEMLKCEFDNACSLSPFYKQYWVPSECLTEQVCGLTVRYGVGQNTPYFVKTAGIWAELFPGVPVPDPLHYGFGAMWAVPRMCITARKRAFYGYLLREIDRIDGWVMELLWRYVFADPTLYPDLTSGSGGRIPMA